MSNYKMGINKNTHKGNFAHNKQDDDELILISWISEYVYCKRRFYMKIIERNDAVNQFIAEGMAVHSSIAEPKIERRGGIVKVTGLEVYSKQLGLYGICDNVEFHKSEKGYYIPFLNEKYLICPIEYKRGRTRNETEYNLQLMAQTICLEEMYSCKIEKGYIYYAGSRERCEVIASEEIRKRLGAVVKEMREYMTNPYYIKPEYKKRCPRCSVFDICAPKTAMVKAYMNTLWKKAE